MRLIEVGHEFADQLTSDLQGYEGECSNTFLSDGGFERGIELGQFDIVDTDRSRVFALACPWRVTCNGLLVLIRKTARAHELHHPYVVEQQNRGTLATQRLQDCI